MNIMPLGLCLSNYLWAVWAIYMSKNDEVQLDYIKFGYTKYLKYL